MFLLLALACVLPFITTFRFKRRLLQIRLFLVQILLRIRTEVMEAASYFLSFGV